MSKDIFAALNIEKSEKTSVLLFLIQSVFLGIFYGAFDVGAHALFLSVYPASMIPTAYVISGIVGIIITTIYARIQNRLPFSSLAIINLLFISGVTAFLRLAFSFTESNWLIFFIFVMMGPLNIVALLGFWGAVGRIFTLRQGKRLFGLIDSGQIFGAILSTFAIPVLIAVGFQQKNLLFLSSVSILCALVVQFFISGKFNLNKQIEVAQSKQKKLVELLKNRYILYMALFVVLSMLAAFFIQYSFLTVTKENYPDHDNLTKFLGAFTGSLLLFTFIFKTFVYSKLMKAYGLKVSILISSFLLGIFTVIAVLIGTFGGYTPAASGFIFFFLIIALTRLFSKALKDSVEVPSFKILYQSLKVEIRHNVQAYIDGTINEIAALSAGLLLAALSLFEFFKLIHFSYSLIVILIAWIFVAHKLYKEYQISLQKSLAEYKGNRNEVESISEFVEKNIDKDIANHEPLIANLEIDFELHPLKFEKKLSQLVKHSNKKVKDFAINKVSECDIYSAISNIKDYLQSEAGESLKEKYQLMIDTADAKINKSPGKNKIISLSKSKNTEERILAAFLMSKFYDKDYFIYLKALIRDLDQQVKIAAVKSAAYINQPEFCPLIIDYIEYEGVYQYAYDALLQFDEKALPFLDQYFYKTGTSHRTLIRIVKLMGQIGGDRAIEYLLRKLDHPNEEILLYILLALKQCNYQAAENNINRIHQILERHIGIMGWNIAARQSLKETDNTELLEEAIDEEIAANYDLLYLLLSIAYDAKSIMHVKENIESGTSEGISYALELLDLFIFEEIKPKLIPIVEDISATEKIRQLQNFYPLEILPFNELLTGIINRDINFINIWTKACAIYSFIDLSLDDGIPDDLVAHLFNPIDLLRQTSAVVIFNENKEKYLNIKSRIKEKFREDLDLTIEKAQLSDNSLIIEKTLILKQIDIFKKVSYKYLYNLARKMFDIFPPSDYATSLSLHEIKDKILFIKGNTASLIVDQNLPVILQPGEIYFMNDYISKDSKAFVIERSTESAVFYIEKNVLIYNMFDYHEIELSFLNWLNKQIEAEEESEVTRTNEHY